MTTTGLASFDEVLDQTSEPRRVLLADDDPVARMMTTRLLERAGYAVTAVGDGQAALAALRERLHAALLTDWEMPIVHGLGVISGVRGDVWPGYVLTILLNGRDSRESVLAGLRAGADDYLTKPVDEAELLARITTVWRIADLERGPRGRNGVVDYGRTHGSPQPTSPECSSAGRDRSGAPLRPFDLGRHLRH
jgi:DNA-binding response OmpR family regulator